MSAVLKALKKLETENKNTDPLTPESSRQNGKAPLHGVTRFKRKGLLAALLLFLIAGSALYLQLHPAGDMSRWIRNRFLNPRKKTVPSASSVVTRPLPVPPSPVAEPPKRPPEKPVQIPGAKPAPPMRETSAAKPVRNSLPRPPAPGTGSSAETAARPAPVPRTPRQRSTPPAIKNPSPPSAAAKTEEFKGTELKLQAIAWSTQPEERLAVINDLILREGDALEGYGIAEIQREAVILRRDSSTQKLVFTTQ